MKFLAFSFQCFTVLILAGAFGLTQAQSQAKQGGVQAVDVESDFWRRISNSKAAEDYQEYLKEYPQGRYAPIARLELQRLKRISAPATPAASGSSSAGAPPGAASPRPRVVATTAPQDPDHPVDNEVWNQIANDPYFQIPLGGGSVAERKTSRQASATVRLEQQSRTQRVAGSNLCASEHKSSSPVFSAQVLERSWAGLVPLNAQRTVKLNNAVTPYTERVKTIANLRGQVFPITNGGVFGFTVDNESNAGGKVTLSKVEWSCRVGASAPAESVVPGLPGTSTGVQCSLAVDAPKVTLESSYLWLDAVGCFLADSSK
jgi:hypothetical protein